MIDKTIYIVEMTAYDPSGPSLLTLRYASGNGFVTTPTDYPASTFYDARLMQPVDITRSVFGNGTLSGRSQVGFGDIKLNNADGALDALLTYGFDGRDVIVRRGNTGTSFPLSFETVFRGTMEQPETDGDSIRIRVREKTFDFRLPLQDTRYDGDNVLPDGLEGTEADIKGAVKPLVYGKVRNISPVLVNTARLIYQISDGPVSSVGPVYDSGIRLSGRAWDAQSTAAFGSNAIYGIAYGNGTWVIVGNGPHVESSTDGVTWTDRTSAAGLLATGYSVAYGNGTWVACDSGFYRYTTDLTTWASCTGESSNVPYGIFWGDGVFVVCCAFGDLRTSTDGITFTTRTSAFTASDVRSGAYGAGRYVIVGAAGKIATSTDAITWALATSPFAGGDTILRCTYGGGQFVAVGTSGKIATSPDGLTWTLRSSGTTATFNGVAYAHGRYIVVAAGGVMLTSPDAATWSFVDSGFGATNINNVAGDGVQYIIAIGDGGNLRMQGATGDAYGSLADLEDDTLAPEPSGFKYYSGASGSYVRLGGTPAGLVTADVTNASSTVPSALLAILQKAGYDRTPNLVVGPEDWGNAAWSKTNVTVTANAVAAPDGTTTADKVEATASTFTNIYQSLGAYNERAITFTCYVKKGSGATDANRFIIWNNTTAQHIIFAQVNYDTGAIVFSTGAGLATGRLTFTSVGSGWYRVRLTATEGWTPGDTLRVYAAFDGTTETAAEYAYLWGAHVAATMDEPLYTYFNMQDLVDVTAMTMGLFINESMSIETALTAVSSSIGLWWGTDRYGQVRFKQLTAPSGSPVVAVVLRPS